MFIFACTKTEYIPIVTDPPVVHKPIMVENMTYDANGVVFKIVNDISHGYKYCINMVALN
jgi:hypothetical protein